MPLVALMHDHYTKFDTRERESINEASNFRTIERDPIVKEGSIAMVGDCRGKGFSIYLAPVFHVERVDARVAEASLNFRPPISLARVIIEKHTRESRVTKLLHGCDVVLDHARFDVRAMVDRVSVAIDSVPPVLRDAHVDRWIIGVKAIARMTDRHGTSACVEAVFFQDIPRFDHFLDRRVEMAKEISIKPNLADARRLQHG